MKLEKIVNKLNLTVIAASHNLSREVKRGYSSDLMSHVMSHAQAGDLWVTVQVHHNTIAIASLLELGGIIISENKEMEKTTIEKAEAEGIPLLTTSLTTFTVVGMLYKMGIKGAEEG
jgi:predicted transcriptional regulator